MGQTTPMKFNVIYLHLLIAIFCCLGCTESTTGSEEEDPQEQVGDGSREAPRILLFTRTRGFRHASISDGIQMFDDLARDQGWDVLHTEDAGLFSPTGLAGYDLIVFLNTTGDVLNAEQQSAMEDFIRSGGSFMGIHSATDTEYGWPWYGELVGAYFDGHPAVQDATIDVVEADHPATDFLGNSWERRDEWYNFRNLQNGINPLLNLREDSYTGGEMGEDHPISWYRTFDGGRTFYTGMGHTPGSYAEEGFRSHILGGVRWCLGE